MYALRALLALGLFAATPGLAQVQDWQPRPGAPALDPHRYQADQHRLDMERLRIQADQRETFVRQLEAETRLNRQRLENARPSELYLATPPRTLRSPEEEQVLRRSASERRATTASQVGQIDAWLDRPRD